MEVAIGPGVREAGFTSETDPVAIFQDSFSAGCAEPIRETSMKCLSLPRLCCAAFLALACAGTQAATAPQNVTVRFHDPQHFTEAKHSSMVHPAHADAYLKPLKAHIVQRASRILTAGQRLDIEVTDVDLAGEYEPWRGPNLNDVRIVKSIYPPRIDLAFTLYGADGAILRQGSRKLRDLSFLERNAGNSQDSLRYEKSMIDRWLRQGVDKL